MGGTQDLPREIECRCGDDDGHVAYRSGNAFICPRTDSVQTYKRPAAPASSQTFREIIKPLDGKLNIPVKDEYGLAEVHLDLKTGVQSLVST